ncbi:MAG TPA: type II secretion system F family protein [archaeon]|nr:type II secretion system F family protein [archaeon]
MQQKISSKQGRFYESLRRGFPSLTNKLGDMGFYAGYENIAAFSGFVVAFSAMLSLAVAFLLFGLGFEIYSLFGFAAGPIFYGLVYFYFSSVADRRASFVEQMLPDNLQLIAGNVRAGMTVDKAIWLSARPEFGILEDEIKKAGGQTMGGKPLKKALTEMADRFKSEIFQRAVRLLLDGIQSGGEVAKLLEETATYIRTAQTMRKEITASVTTYVMFIILAAAFGAPLLFAISIHFVDNIEKISIPNIPTSPEAIEASGGLGEDIKIKEKSVSTDDLFYFALVYLLVTSFFSSMIIGLIKTGKEKGGMGIFPIIFGVAIAVFLISRIVVKSLFAIGG